MKTILLLLTLLSSSAFAQLNNCKILTQTALGATTTSVIGLASRSSRRCLIIQNISAASTIYIKFDSAHTGTEGLNLSAGTIWAPIIVPMNSIYIKGSAGNVSATILSGD